MTATDQAPALQATFPYGRLTVAAGQTISSAWGNTTFDQTMEVFASASDRTNQWPSPNEGAQSWLMDSHTPWVYRAGAWHGIPMGYVASGTGPATVVNVGSTVTTVVTITFPVVAGRRYRVSSNSNAAQATTTGNVRVLLAYAASGGAAITADPTGTAVYLVVQNSAPVGVGVVGSAMQLVTCTTSGTLTANLNASTTAGTYNYTANSASIFAEDIGS